MLVARAIYNNKSDVKDELSFKKGDILEVIERDFNGLNGWWLCRSGGTIGIAPGNRLLLINSLHKSSSLERNLDIDSCRIESPKKILDVPNWHRTDKVVVPRFTGDNYVYDDSRINAYDVPPFQKIYQSPPPTISVSNDEFDSVGRPNEASSFDGDISRTEQTYNVPARLFGERSSPDLVSSNRSSGLSMLSSSSRLSNQSCRSSERLHDLYDVPAQRGGGGGVIKVLAASTERDSLLEDYSVPRSDSVKNGAGSSPDGDEGSRESGHRRTNCESYYDSPTGLRRRTNCEVGGETADRQGLYNIPNNSRLALPTNRGPSNARQSLDLVRDYPSNRSPLTALNDLYFNSLDGCETSKDDIAIINGADVKNSEKVNSMIASMFAWERDVCRHTKRLAELTETLALGNNCDSVNLKSFAQLKLCCLSLKTAGKELVDSCEVATQKRDKDVASAESQAAKNVAAMKDLIARFEAKLRHILATKRDDEVEVGGHLNDVIILGNLFPETAGKVVKSMISLANRSDARTSRVKYGVKSNSLTDPSNKVQCRPLPSVPVRPQTNAGDSTPAELRQECDYVSIAREAALHIQDNIRDQQKSRTSQLGAVTAHDSRPSDKEREMFLFFLQQIESHHNQLTSKANVVFTADDNYLLNSLTAKDLVASSHAIILLAQKIAYCCEMMVRNVESNCVSEDISTAANRLCDLLKNAVITTKKTALNHESLSERWNLSADVRKIVDFCSYLKQIVESFVAA